MEFEQQRILMGRHLLPCLNPAPTFRRVRLQQPWQPSLRCRPLAPPTPRSSQDPHFRLGLQMQESSWRRCGPTVSTPGSNQKNPAPRPLGRKPRQNSITKCLPTQSQQLYLATVSVYGNATSSIQLSMDTIVEKKKRLDAIHLLASRCLHHVLRCGRAVL